MSNHKIKYTEKGLSFRAISPVGLIAAFIPAVGVVKIVVRLDIVRCIITSLPQDIR